MKAKHCPSCTCEMASTIDPATIERVYRGKPGCGCGCSGTYSDDRETIERIVAVMNGRPELIREGAIWSAENSWEYLWAYERTAP